MNADGPPHHEAGRRVSRALLHSSAGSLTGTTA
jgi:hypothetical protein